MTALSIIMAAMLGHIDYSVRYKSPEKKRQSFLTPGHRKWKKINASLLSCLAISYPVFFSEMGNVDSKDSASVDPQIKVLTEFIRHAERASSITQCEPTEFGEYFLLTLITCMITP